MRTYILANLFLCFKAPNITHCLQPIFLQNVFPPCRGWQVDYRKKGFISFSR